MTNTSGQSLRAGVKRRRIGALMLLAALSACSSGDRRPTNVADICAIYRDNPQWARAAAQAEAKWGTPQEVKMAIIWRESAFRADARPPKTYFLGVPTGRMSSAFGYAQALDGTWDWYRNETGNRGADREDFADAIDFVGWYTAKTRALNGVPPTDAFDQYLAYHEGHTGFRRGDWRSKPGVQRAASDVVRQSEIYRAQRARCGAGYAQSPVSPATDHAAARNGGAEARPSSAG